MNLKHLLLGSVALVLATSSQAHALKTLVKVTPDSLGDGFQFEMKTNEKGITRFKITRDPSKANEPSNQDLMLVRGASLKVYGEGDTIVSCPVAERENNKGYLVYYFEIDQAAAKTSHFTLAETDDYKDSAGPRLIGGGTIYEFALIDFIDPDHELKELRSRLKEFEREQLDSIKKNFLKALDEKSR